MSSTSDLPAVRTSLPGPRSRPLLETQARHGYAALRDSHGEVPFVMAAKRGSIIEDVDGNTFVDHVSAWGATPLGAHPGAGVIDAVADAQRRYGMEITDYVHERARDRARRAPGRARARPASPGYAPSISGTLVVEAGGQASPASATGRPMILGFLGQYHGESTYLTAARSHRPLRGHRAAAPSTCPGSCSRRTRTGSGRRSTAAPGPYDDTLTSTTSRSGCCVHQVEPEQIAGVLIEPVLGEGGIVVPSAGVLGAAERLCRRYGWLLILDEVQTGIGPLRHDVRAPSSGASSPISCCSARASRAAASRSRRSLGTEEVMADATPHVGRHVRLGAGRLRRRAGEPRADRDRRRPRQRRRAGGDRQAELTPLVERHEQVGDVRVLGAMVGIEFVTDKRVDHARARRSTTPCTRRCSAAACWA